MTTPDQWQPGDRPAIVVPCAFCGSPCAPHRGGWHHVKSIPACAPDVEPDTGILATRLLAVLFGDTPEPAADPTHITPHQAWDTLFERDTHGMDQREIYAMGWNDAVDRAAASGPPVDAEHQRPMMRGIWPAEPGMATVDLEAAIDAERPPVDPPAADEAIPPEELARAFNAAIDKVAPVFGYDPGPDLDSENHSILAAVFTEMGPLFAVRPPASTPEPAADPTLLADIEAALAGTTPAPWKRHAFGVLGAAGVPQWVIEMEEGHFPNRADEAIIVAAPDLLRRAADALRSAAPSGPPVDAPEISREESVDQPPISESTDHRCNVAHETGGRCVLFTGHGGPRHWFPRFFGADGEDIENESGPPVDPPADAERCPNPKCVIAWVNDGNGDPDPEWDTDCPVCHGTGEAPVVTAPPDTAADRIFFDTEFMEDGTTQTVKLLSIGMVANGQALYAVVTDAPRDEANPWVQQNVIPFLDIEPEVPNLLMFRGTRREVAVVIRAWVQDRTRHPEFWAYYADYDWVALCQLFGSMVDLPDGWPMFCRDLRQEYDGDYPATLDRGIPEHHALADAFELADRFNFASGRAAVPPTSAAENAENGEPI